MKIAKKILFGLLLSGFVFTAACGEPDTKTGLKEGVEGCEAGANAAKEKQCETGLICAKTGTDAKFYCLKECTDATASNVCKKDGHKACTDGNKKEGNAAGKFCKDAAAAFTGAGTAQALARCSTTPANASEKCNEADGLVCVSAGPHTICAKKCDEQTAATACTGDTPVCATAGTVKVCQPGRAGVGATCDENSTDPTTTCAKGGLCDSTSHKCLKECTTVSDSSAECNDATTDGSTAAPKCKALGSTGKNACQAS